MDNNSDLDPLEDIPLIPEISMEVGDTPLELSEEPTESNKPLLPEEQNGEVVEFEGVVSVLNDASGKLNHYTADANQENENPDQIPEIYTLEEVTVHLQIFGPGQQQVQFLRMHCTACNEHLGSAPNDHHKRYIHPLLKVLICKRCYEFYGSGDFDKDEDGSELYCRWCGQGGKVLCCAQCPYVFCQRCIRVNLGKKTLDIVKESDDWTCFACKPLQIINLRITCRALYDYVQEQIRLASELNEPERLSVDHSICCHTKPRVAATKRKRSDSTEIPFDLVLDSDDTYRKKKKMKMNILSHMSAVTNENNSLPVPSPKVWESNVQDEVVCTPDLPMLMEDDEASLRSPTASPQPPPDSPQPSCSTDSLPVPPLRAISPFANGVDARKDSEVQFIGQTRVVSTFKPIRPAPPKKNTGKSNAPLGYKLPNVPVVLNTSTNKPLTSNSMSKNVAPNFVHLQAPAVRFNDKSVRQPVVTVAHNRNNSVIDATPARLAPGLRYEWFDKAAQVTARVNQNLSTRLCSLSKEQSTVSSLEGLASIHNNLQEILSNSINSLMQIRKNLRSDFIAGLKKLKFCKTQDNMFQSEHGIDDNDVIIVDSNTPNATLVPNSANNSNENKPRGYIKVKPASELLDSAIITIPDDNVASDNTVIPSTNNDNVTSLKDSDGNITPAEDNNIAAKDTDAPNDANAQNDKNSVGGNEPTASNYVNTNEALSEIEMSEVLNPETVTLIKRAVLESKFEAIVNDNLKFNVENIPHEPLKRMLSVRVVVETNFGSSTPKTAPRKGYKAMNIENFDEQDIEQMLSSSIVVNTSKRKAFDDSFSAFVANRTQQCEENEDETASESHISNEGNDNDNDVCLPVDSDGKVDNLDETDETPKLDDSTETSVKEAGLDTVSENEETSHDPRTTDSGIDVDGEQSLSNGDKNYE